MPAAAPTAKAGVLLPPTPTETAVALTMDSMVDESSALTTTVPASGAAPCATTVLSAM